MDFNKLHNAIAWSQKTLERPRKERKEAVRQYVGFHYADKGTKEKNPVNLVELAATIYLRHLAARVPKCIVRTDVPDLRPFAADMEIALNQIPGEINLASTLRRVVSEALFSIGIVKVGLGSTNENAKIGDEPFVSIVQLDDYFCDMSARSWEEVQYEGNDYWMDAEQVKAMYGKELQGDDDNGVSADGQSHVHTVSVDESSVPYSPRVLLRDVYLVRENRMVTYAVETQQILRDVPWDGPEGTPYIKLWFSDVPGNLMPLPPVAVWRDLNELANKLFRKLAKQTMGRKSVAAFQGGNEDAITRLKMAQDGEAIRYDGAAPEQITIGGTDQGGVAFFLQTWDRFNLVAGNIDSLGGLSPQADTAAQEKLISESSSVRLHAMADATVEFAKAIFKRLAWYMWTDPVRERTLVKTATGRPDSRLAITKKWTPETRDGDFLDYNFEIDVFSMQDDSPATRVQKFLTAYERVILPMLPQLQEQGAQIDLRAVLEWVGENSNLNELADFVMFPNQPAERRQPSGGSPRPEYVSTKAPVTHRTYERVNRPGATRQGRDAALMQTLLGGNPQQAEKAALSASRSIS